MPNTKREKSPTTSTTPSSGRGWTPEEWEEFKRAFQERINANIRAVRAAMSEEDLRELERMQQYRRERERRRRDRERQG